VSWIIRIYKTSILKKNMAPSLIQDATTKAMFNDVTLHRIIAPIRPPNIHLDAYMTDILNMIMVHSLSGYGDDIQGKYIVSLAPFINVLPAFKEAKKHIRMKSFWYGPFKIILLHKACNLVN